MDIGHLTFVALTFVLAGFVKGVIGLGLPTVGMGLLAIVMTPAQAAALLVAPSFITNVWQAVGTRRPSRRARADLSTIEGGYHLQSMIMFGTRLLTVFP
jgi:uncharacterized membrane protein YfcA